MTSNPMLQTIAGAPWADYALLDSGDGQKLERYGDYRIIRPEAQAMWAPATGKWAADARFIPGSDADGGGRWDMFGPLPREGWPMAWDDVRFNAELTPFRHLGFFPDMAPVWTWLRGEVAGMAQPKFLNLFGYTGVGSLAMAARGAEVVHVDASKKSVTAARANAAMSGLADAPIRWLVDDAVKFVEREGRRNRRYDAILLDPPKYGRGPDGEIWQLEADLPRLIAALVPLLDGQSRALFLTVYAVRMSAIALHNLLAEALAPLGGRVEAGELGVVEEARGLTLPTAIWARWSRD